MLATLARRSTYFVYLLTIQIFLWPVGNSSAHYLATQDSISIQHPLDSLEPAMYKYQVEGYDYYMVGDYENASKSFSKALEIAKQLYSSLDERLADSYMNLGAINMMLWDYNSSLDLLNKAENIYANLGPYHIHMGSVSVNKGIIYRKLRDYDKAITFYNHAIKVFESQKTIDYSKLQISYWNLAYVYSLSEDYERSNEFFKKSILFDKSRSNELLLAYYSKIASNYRQLGNLKLADENFKKALILADRVEEILPSYPYHAIYTDYGVYQMDQKHNYNYAKELFFKSLSESNKSQIENTEAHTIAYHNIGEIYYQTNIVDSALLYFQKSLITAIESFQDSNVYNNPSIDIKKEKPRILNTLKFKAKTFLKKYEIEKSTTDLEFCLETYLLIYELIDQMRLMYDSESSSFLISKQEDETFINGILVSEKLYSITGDEKFLESAFQINEKRKSFTLLTSIRKTEAKNFGGIPLKLLNQESELFNRIAAYEELIFEERKKNIHDQDKIDNWEELRFGTLKLYDELVNTFEAQYPEYYRLKYDASTASIEQIQASLSQGEVLIEYVLTDSSLVTFMVERNNSEILISVADSTFRSTIDYLRNYLSSPQFSENARQHYKDYCFHANKLYTDLFGSIQESIEGKSLIIVPDGLLWYIPFESLLTASVDDLDLNYRSLPYLIRENPISYTYSATLHFEKSRRIAEPSKELLAFAPDYSNLFAQVPAGPEFLEAYRDNLVPIPGVKDEVKMISRMIPGDVLMGDEATETNFKEMAGSYDILHLAMHTVVNNEDPMYSKLAFQQKIDSENDGFLNTYEIYNMRYNARMAVLSSCNTGYGKLMKGEGVMSLARGFMYAGCPSIVMTLWEVSDKSGARLMRDFYKYLKAGKSKAEALQLAKLDFLKKADNLKANPYFWSTYVVIGDSGPLYPGGMRLMYWIAILVVLTGSMVGILRRRAKMKGLNKDGFNPNSMYT